MSLKSKNGNYSVTNSSHSLAATEVAFSARLLLFRPASFSSYELFVAPGSRVLLSTAKPLSCPFNFPDVVMDEVSFSNFSLFLAEPASYNQLVVVLSILSCAVR
jgi:hypothetical protein